MLHFSVLVWMYKQEETDTWHNSWVLVGWCLMTYICQLSSQWNSGRTSSPSFRYLYTATIRSFFLKLFMLPVMFNPIYRWSVSSRCLADLKLDKNNQRSISQKKNQRSRVLCSIQNKPASHVIVKLLLWQPDAAPWPPHHARRRHRTTGNPQAGQLNVMPHVRMPLTSDM
jgi:hypothetical protein